MDLSVTVDRVGATCRRFRIDSLAPQLAACEELLGGGGVVGVAVLGQFKAGKSSFLNGLIVGRSCRWTSCRRPPWSQGSGMGKGSG